MFSRKSNHGDRRSSAGSATAVTPVPVVTTRSPTTTSTTTNTSTTTTTTTAERAPLERSRSIRISLQQRPSARLSSSGSFKATCISKFYALNHQILAAFDSNYQSQLWEAAYHFGFKFVESALLEIPKHGYFYSNKFADLRRESTRDVLRVCGLLDELCTQDSTSEHLFSNQRGRIRLLNGLATTLKYKPFPEVYEPARKRTKRELAKAYPKKEDISSSLLTRNNVDNNNDNDSLSSVNRLVTLTLMACGDTFASVFCPGANPTTGISQEEHKAIFPNDPSTESVSPKKSRLYPSFSSEERQPEESRSSGIWPDNGGRSFDSGSRDSKSSSSLYGKVNQGDHHRVRSSYPSANNASAGTTRSTNEVQRYPSFGRQPSSGSNMFPGPLPLGQTQSDYDLQRALFISGLHVTLQADEFSSSISSSIAEVERPVDQGPVQPSVAPPPGATKRTETPCLELLATCYKEDFEVLCQRGRISVRTLDTFQGRVPGSINGCTVIAPLLCIHHFVSGSSIPDRGLPDETIVHVIDEETPNILPRIRETLGLVKDAFLIPADAHDFLMDESYMCQEQFLTVCGGNILDETHLESFIMELSAVGNQKLAATFFFHEHVITILQLRHDSRSAWFELIDSLPHAETFSEISSLASIVASMPQRRSSCGAGPLHQMGTSSRSYNPPSVNGYSHDKQQGRISLPNPESLRGFECLGYQEAFMDEEETPRRADAARIRCMDAESLKVALMWYACSVFSEDNRAYIDAYEWDEKLADFDPRVFQAFIWTEVS